MWSVVRSLKGTGHKVQISDFGLKTKESGVRIQDSGERQATAFNDLNGHQDLSN